MHNQNVYKNKIALWALFHYFSGAYSILLFSLALSTIPSAKPVDELLLKAPCLSKLDQLKVEWKCAVLHAVID